MMAEIMPAAQPQIASPCVSICRLNDEQICIGCGRSAAEITAWLAYSDAQRAHLMQVVLPLRLESMFD